MNGCEDAGITVTISNLEIDSPRCDGSSGYFDLDITATDSSTGEQLNIAGYLNIIDLDEDCGEDCLDQYDFSYFSPPTYSNIVSALEGTYTIEVDINGVQGNPSMGASLFGCVFTMPNIVFCCDEENPANCMIDEETEDGQQIFYVEEDYDPIIVEYEWVYPPCSPYEGGIIITEVAGGGCTDPSGTIYDESQYIFSIQDNDFMFGETCWLI